MKKKVVRKVFACRKCGSHDLWFEGCGMTDKIVRFDGVEGISYGDLRVSYEGDECYTRYVCNVCRSVLCFPASGVEAGKMVRNEIDLMAYLWLHGVEQTFEVEVPENTEVKEWVVW